MGLELSNGRSWKSFEAHDRKSLDCLKKTVGRNTNVKGDLVRGQQQKRGTVENASTVLENTYIIKNRMLLEV